MRIRLHEFTIRDGSTAYGVEISAWNAWAGQAKLLFFAGGLAYDDAFAMFTEFSKHVRGYDWMEGDFVFENIV